MTGTARNPELLALAGRIVWFETPEKALADQNRFLAYLMTYGTWDDVVLCRRYFTEADFRQALVNAPPGVFDARSWCYWHLMAGRHPPPPMPRRVIP